MNDTLYTAGEIAKIAGVSLKTIRFYDSKGLLVPVSYSEAGYRYYDRNSLMTLQRILMLKYLGFSLREIGRMLEGGEHAQVDMDSQLSHQKELLIHKKQHLEELIAVIEKMETSADEIRWNYLVKLLNLLTDEEKIVEQYQNAANLEKRINIHNYSTSRQDWMDWVYERLGIKSGDRVLEIGCGTGRLWQKNINKIPKGVKLLLTDRSEGMLEQTRNNLECFHDLLARQKSEIAYQVMDAEHLNLGTEQYDIIIANHMLYHVMNRKACLEQIKRSLKNEGTFFCSTVGQSHMKELHDLVREFDSRLEIPLEMTIDFTLENGRKQLEQYFTDISCETQNNNLLVDDIEAIYNYVYSYPGNAPCILEQKGDKFRALLQHEMEKKGAIFITKSTGMFRCTKNTDAKKERSIT